MNKRAKILPQNKLVSIIVVLIVLGGFFIITSGILFEPAAMFSGNAAQQSTQMNNHTAGVKTQQMINLEKEVDNNPTNYDNLLKLAHLLGDNGFYLDAILRYDQYLKDNPNVADVLVDQGVCYFNMKNYSKAIEKMETAVRLKPKHEIAHLNLGVVNMAAGNKDEAIRWWNKLIKINPNSDMAERAKKLINSH